MKKDRGRLDDCLYMMVSLLLVFLVTMILFHNMDVLQKKIDINQLSRQYILKMETLGYLPPSDIAELAKKLQEIGVTEVSFAGTTTQQAGYGNDVILEYKGNLHYNVVRLPVLFSPDLQDGTIAVHEKRISTAKN